MTLNNRAFLSAIAILAFALGQVTSTFVSWIEPGYAAPRERFEYRRVQLPIQLSKGTEMILNDLGADGWEISYGFGELIILKRSW